MATAKGQMDRLDIRLPRKQKRLFETAYKFGGFRTMTEFVVQAAEEKAKALIDEHENWLASERDREKFFTVLSSPPAPNQYTKDAAKRYKEALVQAKAKK